MRFPFLGNPSSGFLENEFHLPDQLMLHCFRGGGNNSAFSLALPKEARPIVNIPQGKPIACFALPILEPALLEMK
jgi:hypothetical protein